MPKIEASPRFDKAFSKLEKRVRKAVERTILLLSDNPRHPGLHVKRLKSTEAIYAARVSRGVRLTFEAIGEETILLRSVGPHDSTLSKP